MGKRSRHRRRAAADAAAIEQFVWLAVAACQARSGQAPSLLDALTAHGRHGAAVATGLLTAAVDQARTRGWSSEDLRHVVGRTLSMRHASRHPLGDHPVDDSLVDQLRTTVETLALVVRLPEIPPAGPVPSGPAATTHLDHRVLRRVRALLSKAESTEFEEEAEALTAKAQELVTRHAIDALLLDPGAGDGPTSRRVHLDDPYVDAKSVLLGSVARANRCDSVFTPGFGWSTVFGYPADLDVVELLFGSLLVQAAHAIAREGSRTDALGRSRTRSFRRSFLYGFAHRIGERLGGAAQSQIDEAETAGAAVLPVLAARDERVQQLQSETFPRLQSRSVSVSNAAGWAAGQAAAATADLAVGKGRVGRGGTP